MNPALIFQTAVLIVLGLAGLIVLLLNLSDLIDLFENKDKHEKD